MKKFNLIYEQTMNALSSTKPFDFASYKLYGAENSLECIKKGKPRKATRATEEGSVQSTEGEEHYKAGEWIVIDDQGNPYIVSNEDFERLYDFENPSEEGYYDPKPDRRVMAKLDKEIEVDTPWGLLSGLPNDWCQVKEDGSFGPPIKPAAMNSAYEVVDNETNNIKIAESDTMNKEEA